MRQLSLLTIAVLLLAALPAQAKKPPPKPIEPFGQDANSSIPKTAPAAPKKAVVRLAPDFTFPGPGNKARSLRSLRGQPVVLVIAPSARDKLFRKQVDRLQESYSQFASRQAILIAAFTRDNEGIIKSNSPWAIANNGPAVAAAYGFNDKDFGVIIIGKDGNVDYQTFNLLSGDRVADVIQNSYVVQAQARKDTNR